MNGYAILGAPSDRVITVRVKNALALAKNQSALASVAAIVPGAGPAFVEGQTHEAIAQKIAGALAEQGADAEVRVLDGSAVSPQAPTRFLARAKAPGPGEEEGEIWKFTKTYGWGIGVGMGVSGIALAVWHYFFRNRA